MFRVCSLGVVVLRSSEQAGMIWWAMSYTRFMAVSLPPAQDGFVYAAFREGDTNSC